MYNGSWISSDTLTYIRDTMSFLSIYAKELIGAKQAQQGGCSFYPKTGPQFYSCTPVIPFSYDIAVLIDGYRGQNQSAQYQGSIIEIG